MEDVRAQLRAQLEADARAFGRAVDTQKRTRDKLGETIRAAYAAKIGPAEIGRLIGHRLTEKTVTRIAKGEA